MAAIVQPVVTLNEPTGTLTVSFTYDSVTLLVTGVAVVNNLGHDYTFTVTNTANPIQTFTFSLAVGGQTADVSALGWMLNPDASLTDGWEFQG